MGDMFKNNFFKNDFFKNDYFKNNVLSKKKFYCVLEEGMIKGVCVGLVYYFDILVWLICVMVVLLLFFGLFVFIIVVYIVLIFVLEFVFVFSFSEYCEVMLCQFFDQLEYELGVGE